MDTGEVGIRSYSIVDSTMGTSRQKITAYVTVNRRRRRQQRWLRCGEWGQRTKWWPRERKQVSLSYWLNGESLASAQRAKSDCFYKPSNIDATDPTDYIGSISHSHPRQGRLKYWRDHQLTKPVSTAAGFLSLPPGMSLSRKNVLLCLNRSSTDGASTQRFVMRFIISYSPFTTHQF